MHVYLITKRWKNTFEILKLRSDGVCSEQQSPVLQIKQINPWSVKKQACGGCGQTGGEMDGQTSVRGGMGGRQTRKR